MTRDDLKSRVATLLSDLGLLKKIRLGRCDELVDTFPEAPDFWKEAVLNRRSPSKDTREFRWARNFAMDGKLPRRSGGSPRKSVPPEGPRIAWRPDGTVAIRDDLSRELALAGVDLDQEVHGLDPASVSHDLARGILATEMVFPDVPHYNDMVGCAAALIDQGIFEARRARLAS